MSLVVYCSMLEIGCWLFVVWVSCLCVLLLCACCVLVECWLLFNVRCVMCVLCCVLLVVSC